MVQEFREIEACADELPSPESSNNTNIFLGLTKYELNSLLGALHLVDYVSVQMDSALQTTITQ